MEEEIKAYSKKEVTKIDNETSLGEDKMEVEKIKEESKASTGTRKKKEEVSLWNFLDFIPPPLFLQLKR